MSTTALCSQNDCHRILLVDEVLDRIFRELHRRSLQGSLASAARTCKAWNEVATRIIWERVEDAGFLGLVKTYNLLKVIHRSLFFCLEDPKLISGISPCQIAQSQQSMDRFRHLCHYVRSFSFSDEFVIDIQVDGWLAALGTPGMKTLWPRLEEVRWSENMRMDLSLPTLVGPALRKLVIPQSKVKTDSGSLSRVLRRLRDVRPNLSTLEFKKINFDQGDFNDLLDILAQLPDLKRLVLTSNFKAKSKLDCVKFLMAVHGHESLEKLSIIGAVPAETDPSWTRHLGAGSFRSIKELMIEDCPPDFLRVLQQLRSPPRLTCLHLGGGVHQVQETIEEASLHPQLRNLHIEGATEASPISLPHDILNCLISCPLLEALGLTIHQPVPINDDDIKALVTGCPFLSSVSFNIKGSQLSLFSLVHLVEGCRGLKLLLFEFDGTIRLGELQHWTPWRDPEGHIPELQLIFFDAKRSKLTEDAVPVVAKLFKKLFEKKGPMLFNATRGRDREVWKYIFGKRPFPEELKESASVKPGV